jgi:hypothetical protein
MPVGSRYVHQNVQTGSRAHQASYSMDTGSLSLGARRPVCKAGHLSQSNAEVKTGWRSTSTSPICRHGAYKYNFAFTCALYVVCVLLALYGKTNLTDRCM